MNRTPPVSTPRRAALAALALVPVGLALMLGAPLAQATYPPPLRARRFAVAADNADASRAGAEVLRAGGSAADAAIATVLALGVASPASSGFGGGGFATVCTGAGECTFLDFRETAPAAITMDAYRNAPDPAHASTLGGLAVGVPGEPAGMLALSRRFGRIPLARAVAPAVTLARRGFELTDWVASRIDAERANLARDPSLAALFLPGGNPLQGGARVRRPRLATALERFGREGERFITGPYASAVAARVREAGGVMTEDDVRNYQVVWREPLAATFRGYRVVTAPPPSAGGIILLEALDWVDHAPAEQLHHGSSAYDHLLASAFRGGFDDRARYVGDPAGGRVPDLLDPARMAQRRAAFDPSHAAPAVVIEPARDHGTTHVCVVDASGMMVSLTTTVNLAFGARIAVAGMDVILNDEMDDFSLGTPGNNFGLAGSAPNALAPGHRPVSSMAPTIVLRDGRPFACAGGGGGPRIATATTQVVLNMLVHGMDPEAAVASPRVHHQGTPDQLLVDREVPDDVRVGLRARGYDVQDPQGPLAVEQAVMVRAENGRREVTAASDPRKGAVAAGE